MKLKLNQTEYWSNDANKKKFNHEIEWGLLNSLITKNTKILDYGCGYGRLTNNAFENGYTNVIGIDNSKGMIEQANTNFPNLFFSQNTSEKIDFPDKHFDLILLFTVLTCIPLESDQKQLIKELNRILKPNGILYVSDLLINSDQRNINRYDSSHQKPYGVFKHNEGVILRHHAKNYLDETIFKNFNILNEKTFEVITMNGNKSKAIQLIGRKNNQPSV